MDRPFMVKWESGELTIHASSEEEARMVVIAFIKSEAKRILAVQEVDRELVGL